MDRCQVCIEFFFFILFLLQSIQTAHNRTRRESSSNILFALQSNSFSTLPRFESNSPKKKTTETSILSIRARTNSGAIVWRICLAFVHEHVCVPVSVFAHIFCFNCVPAKHTNFFLVFTATSFPTRMRNKNSQFFHSFLLFIFTSAAVCVFVNMILCLTIVKFSLQAVSINLFIWFVFSVRCRPNITAQQTQKMV